MNGYGTVAESDSTGEESTESTGEDLSTWQVICRRIRPWAILSCAVLMMGFIGGQRDCCGIFVEEMNEESSNHKKIDTFDWIFSVQFFLTFFMVGPCAFVLRSKRLHTWQHTFQVALGCSGLLQFASWFTSGFVARYIILFATLSVPNGLASAIAATGCTLIVAEYYPPSHRLHVLATNVFNVGAVFALVWCPLNALMATHLGVAHTFLALAGVSALLSAACATMFFRSTTVLPAIRNDSKDNLTKDSNKFTTSCKAVAFNLNVYLWCAKCLLNEAILTSLRENIGVYFAEAYNNGHATVDNAIYFFACGNAAAVIVGMAIGDVLVKWLLILFIIDSMATSCVLFIFYNVSLSLTAADVLAVILGLVASFTQTCLYAAGQNFTGLPGHVALSITAVMEAIGVLITPLVSGLLMELFSCRVMFLSLGIMSLVLGVSLIGIWTNKLRDAARQ